MVRPIRDEKKCELKISRPPREKWSWESSIGFEMTQEARLARFLKNRFGGFWLVEIEKSDPISEQDYFSDLWAGENGSLGYQVIWIQVNILTISVILNRTGLWFGEI